MKVFNIPSHRDFLEELIIGIEKNISKDLVGKTLILLPSHRICKELEYKLIQRNFGKNIIPPKMISIGSIEQELSFAVFDELASLPNAITNTAAKFLLSDLLSKSHDLSNVVSLNIASDLLSLTSKFEKEDLPLDTINKIFVGDAPAHVEKIFYYLKLISNTWPKLLSEKKQTTTVSRRNALLKLLIKKWIVHPPKHPIIVAGSTGTFKTTQLLFKSISTLENGFVVLQGMENLEEKHFDETDPSFQLYSLVRNLNINFDNILPWHNHQCAQKSILLQTFSKTNDAANDNSLLKNKKIEYLECSTSQEESKIIALKARELLHMGMDNIGIVTNDQNLRTRVQANLISWSIDSESSDGLPFKATEQYSFMTSIFDVYLTNFSPLSLLKLLRHEFCLLGIEKTDLLGIASSLEIQYLRGIRKYLHITDLVSISKNKGDYSISSILQSLYNHLKPLFSLLKTKRASIKNIFSTLKTIAENISINAKADTPQIWYGEIGIKTYDIVNATLNILPTTKTYAHDFQEVFDQAISDHNIFCSSQIKPQIRILSPIDSRLIKFDYVILAGLNEKNWPGSPEIDPWISSLFYQNIGIPDHRVKIGQSANDFFSLLAQHDKVLLTRAKQNNGSPQVASRWVTNIEIHAKQLGVLEKIKNQSSYMKEYSKFLSTPEKFLKYEAPFPKPPISIRPTKLSVTQVEKLMRDPYSIYASKILKLKPLEPIDKKPNQLEFGNIIHDIINTFNNQHSKIKEHDYYQKLIEIGEQKLQSLNTNPIIHKLWIPRFSKIAKYLTEYETLSRKSCKINSEVVNEITLTKNFSLIAKIDRIESRLSNDTVAIGDFKTGTIPTQEDIKNGLSPQLTLGAFLVESINKNKKVTEMIYIQLATGKKLGQVTKVKGDYTQIIKAAQEGILELVKKYSDPNTAYLVCPNPNKTNTYNEFEHLERIDELL